MGYWEQTGADNRRREQEMRDAPWFQRVDWFGIGMTTLAVAVYGLLAFALARQVGLV